MLFLFLFLVHMSLTLSLLLLLFYLFRQFTVEITPSPHPPGSLARAPDVEDLRVRARASG